MISNIRVLRLGQSELVRQRLSADKTVCVLQLWGQSFGATIVPYQNSGHEWYIMKSLTLMQQLIFDAPGKSVYTSCTEIPQIRLGTK